MKKVIIGLILVLLIVGCGGKVVEQSTPEPQEKEPESAIRVVDKLPSENTAEKALPGSSVTLPKAIRELKAKAETVESVEYSINKYQNNNEGYAAKVWVKGNKQKHVYPDVRKELGFTEWYDVVYIDGTSTKGYCEVEFDDCPETIDNPASPSLNSLVTMTPFDLLEEITNAEIVSSSLFDKKDATVIEYEKNGQRKRVWLWDWKGLPLKYEIYDSDDNIIERIEFRGLNVNQVKDSEVTKE